LRWEDSVRRETISGYLKAAGIAVHGRGRRSESTPKPAISEEVSTDLGTTGHCAPGGVHRPGASAAAGPSSECERLRALYRELIAAGLARGRNAVAICQDLVDDHGFRGRYASVRRFVVDSHSDETSARLARPTVRLIAAGVNSDECQSSGF
jgi:hypothetical protein